MANERGPVYADQALGMLREANPQRLPTTLIVGGHEDTVGVHCHFPRSLRSVVVSQFGAAYPDCSVHRLRFNSLDAPPDFNVRSVEIRLRPQPLWRNHFLRMATLELSRSPVAEPVQ